MVGVTEGHNRINLGFKHLPRMVHCESQFARCYRRLNAAEEKKRLGELIDALWPCPSV